MIKIGDSLVPNGICLTMRSLSYNTKSNNISLFCLLLFPPLSKKNMLNKIKIVIILCISQQIKINLLFSQKFHNYQKINKIKINKFLLEVSLVNNSIQKDKALKSIKVGLRKAKH
jgi:hypothetical protein